MTAGTVVSPSVTDNRRHAVLRSPPLIPTLILMAWALLLAAWVMGNAPFAAPDEAQHYIRAVGVSQGHLIGTAAPSAGSGSTPTQMAWTAQAARSVSLPRGLDPDAFACELGPGERSAACLNAANQHPPPVTLVTAVGNYQPVPYLLPAVALSAAHSPPAALRFARAAGALVVLALLAVALFALYEPEHQLLSLLGLMLAVTPMVLFCGASLSGSGTEIAGGIAFFCCLLRVGRSALASTRWWVCTAISGSLLALSRSASPGWLLLGVLVTVGWGGPQAFVRRWTAGWAPRLTAGVLVLAVAINRIWEALYGSHISLDTTKLHPGLVAGVHEWWRALPDLVGKFGYLEVKLPVVVPILWFALVLALFVTACVVCQERERLVLTLVLAVALVGPVIFYALLLRPTGFGLQGRHILPILIVVPLLAGEAVTTYSGSVRTGWLLALAMMIPAATGIMQLMAWYVNAKRYAVGGSGPEWFLSHAAWSPPTGWWTWFAATVLASFCLGVVALVNRNATSSTGTTLTVS